MTPFGSAGDVYPLIGIGSVLLRRGHRVTVITNAYFEDVTVVPDLNSFCVLVARTLSS